MQKLQHSWKAYYIRCSQNPALGSLGMTQQNIVNEMTGFADYFLECKKKGWNNPSLRSLNEGKHPGLKRRPNLIGWLHMNEKSKNKMFQTTEALHYVSMYINHMYHPLKKKKNLRTPPTPLNQRKKTNLQLLAGDHQSCHEEWQFQARGENEGPCLPEQLKLRC